MFLYWECLFPGCDSQEKELKMLEEDRYMETSPCVMQNMVGRKPRLHKEKVTKDMRMSCVSDSGNGYKWIEQLFRRQHQQDLVIDGMWWPRVRKGSREICQFVWAYAAGCDVTKLTGMHLLIYYKSHCIILHCILHFHKRFIYFCYAGDIIK